ncbi:MAG TPA: protein kinase [Pyrinomonadaceae bacterium]|jgi:serine/threonine-protein kinase
MKYCPICNAKYEDSVSFCATDGEVLEEDVTSLVDSTLDGQYHIEAMLGKGGMGAVYRARHILLGDRVAIKVLPPQMRNNAEWLRRFRREGQAARRFRHPNSVQVYDLRTTPDGMTYMVMEYVEGRTLDAELKEKGRFTPQEAFQTLEPITSVLNAAHAQGVVHRDLKPENIMIGKPVDGQAVVKLLDLGIAKISDLAGGSGAASPGTTALTVAGQILGTPYYMSPEQWGEVPRDRKEEVDGRADIYSLGAVFYELISGRKPFMGLTLAELRGQHVKAMPQPLHEFMTDVPQGFSLAIQRALSKDRGDRQATAGEFANELRSSLGMAQLSSTGSSLSTSAPDAQGSSASQTGVSAPPAGTPPTLGQPEVRQTGTDVAAPTMVTMDAPPRPPDSSPAPWANQPPPQTHTGQQSQPPSSSTSPVVGSATANNAPANAAMPTMMTGGAAAPAYGQSGASYATGAPAQTPSYTPAPQQAQQGGRSLVLPIVGGVLVLLLLVGGAGSYFIYKSMSGGGSADKNGTDKPVVADTGDKKTGDSTKPAAATVEAMRYALEVEQTKGGERARVAGTVPLASGQTFKFHFTATEEGYLYIVGPGPGNVPMTFLTSKPVKQSGVKNNEAQADTDYEFPYGDGNWITLDQNPGTEDYTIIFSTEPLESPTFLTQLAGKTLTEGEQSEFFNFVGQYKANAPTVDVSQGGAADPFVSIKVPEGRKAGEPIIFTVRIEHK